MLLDSLLWIVSFSLTVNDFVIENNQKYFVEKLFKRIERKIIKFSKKYPSSKNVIRGDLNALLSKEQITINFWKKIWITLLVGDSTGLVYINKENLKNLVGKNNDQELEDIYMKIKKFVKKIKSFENKEISSFYKRIDGIGIL